MTTAELITHGDVEGFKLHQIKEFVIKHDGIGFGRCPELIKKSYGDVLLIREAMAEGRVLEALALAAGVSLEFLLERDDNEFMGFWRHISEEIEAIDKAEENLSGQMKAKLVEAGIDRLRGFNEYNAIDALAGGDLLKWDEVKSRPYEEVYTKLLKDRIQGEVSENYQRLINKKNG